MKRLVLYLLLTLTLGGCTRQAEISGQVFIVTKARENIKLALVDVAAIPAEKVPDFSSAKSKADERQKMLAPQVEKARAELESSKAAFELYKLLTKYVPKNAEDAVEAGQKYVEKAPVFDKIKAEHDGYSNPRYYLGHLPAATVVAKTDADGRFKMTHPHGKYMLVAATNRKVMDRTEDYFWLVLLDTNTNQSLMLSNDNQVETKCKECVRLPL